MVHLGDSSNNLWHSMFDGRRWTPNVQIPGEKSKAAPALAFDGTVLHLVHLGDSSNDLWKSQFDGASWSPNIRVAEEKSKAVPRSPPLRAWSTWFILATLSNNLWHSRLDFGAANLTPQIVHEICHAAGVIHEQSCEDRDWFVTIDEDEIQEGKEHNYEKRNDEAEDSGLYDYDLLMHYGPFFFAKGVTPVMTPGIATSGFTGSFANIGKAAGLSAGDIETLFALYPAWSENVRIPDQASCATPALAEFAGLLHCVHIGRTSNDLWHSTFNGTAWSPNVKIPGQKSKSPAALAVFNGLLHMVHLGDTSNNIWHSVFDGTSWSTNVKIPDQKSKVAPALAVFGGRLHMVHLGDFLE